MAVAVAASLSVVAVRRWAWALFLVGSALSIWPFYRDLTPEGRHVGLFGGAYMFHLCAPLLAVTLASMANPKQALFMDRLCAPRPLMFGGTVVVGITPVLLFLHVPGLWWTWGTVALYAGTCLLAYDCARGAVGPFRAVIVAGGVFGLAAAIWEVLYQSSYAWCYPQDFAIPPGAANNFLALSPHVRVGLIWTIGQAERMALLAAGGGAAMWWAYRPRLRIDTTLAVVVCCCLFAAWCVFGLPLEVRWTEPVAGVTQQFYHTNTPAVLRALQRLVKEAVTVAVLSLYWRR